MFVYSKLPANLNQHRVVFNLKLENGLDGNDLGRKRSKMQAFVCRNEKRLQKLLRARASSDVRRLKDISVPRRQELDDQEVEGERFVKPNRSKRRMSFCLCERIRVW